MNYTQKFMVEGMFLGETERGKHFNKGELQAPYSEVFVCGGCGDTYAKCPVTDRAGKLQPFMIRGGTCGSCVPWYKRGNPPGSIWQSWDEEFIKAFPPELIDREFHLMLDWIDKRLQDE